MRTFIIFPKDKAEYIDASSVQAAINKFRKKYPERRDYAICIATHVVHDIPEQGVVITETPKQEACDPEDSKPEHKEV